jgi:hypothetical protein
MQWKMLKAFCVKWRDYAVLISVYDKAIVPVGDPNKTVSTNVRHRTKSLVAGETPLLSLDHDYHVAGIVPSIMLKIDIPDNESDSFHRGKLYVRVKDKFFEPSTPMRHSAETMENLRGGLDVENVDQNLQQPMLLLFSDGGPDHNPTFKSVQLAALVMFMGLDLDCYIAIRCAPSQSYTNPAERCMSVLNVPLQSVSLCRSTMDNMFEVMVKHASTLTEVRTRANRIPMLKEQLNNSMQQPIDTVLQRFRRTR